MNKNTSPNNRQLLQFVLRAQHLARKDARTDEGYAMMVVSIVTILLFSLLGAFMTMTNLSKSSTNAYIDSSNTFYASESGLNARAEQLRQKFIGFATPTGTTPGTAGVPVTPNTVANCFGIATAATATANDFECRNFAFTYTRNSDVLQTPSNTTSSERGSLGGSAEVFERNSNVTYNAYTFVADRTNYVAGTNPPAPNPIRIPAGQAFAGLNSLEYSYTIFSTAAKPDAAGSVQTSDARTVLELNFKSRIVPLFQFAAFYNEDLEMTSTSTMTLSGNVHTNGNLYLQPTPNIQPAAAGPTGVTTYLWSPVTSAGQIYNQVASSGNPRYSPPRFLRSGNPFTNTPVPVYYADNNFGAAMTSTPLTAPQILAYGGQLRDGAAGAQVLRTPDAGFLRKRNYFNNKVGEYYGKADIRLEMVPDRGTDKTTTPWTPNAAVIPFNFTSIQTGATGACTTTAPTAGNDPANDYIDPTRQNATNLRCNSFRKGQLQSLRQPVMVRTNLNQTGGAALQATESQIWNPTGATNPAADPTNVLRRPPLPVGIPTVAVADRNAVLRALQVAIVSTPIPITLDALNTPLNDAIYNTDSLALTDGSLLTFRTRFAELLNTGVLATALTPADRTALLSASPNAIAAIDEAWFLPAPIQRVEHGNNAANVPTNTRRSGFYDGRERRWITMLQTNMVSLAVWNRDGLFVEATNEDMTTFYASDLPSRTTAFNNGNGVAGSTNSTAGLAFLRAPAVAGAAGLPGLGLGASDGVVANTLTTTPTTEGGLVFHMTVNDDLNGDGAINAADDITTNGNIFRRNSLTNADTTEVMDLRRSYLGGANTGVSPFGFAVNGGDYLPAALTIATDQPIYIQGDFNNNGADQPLNAPNNPSTARLSAAIMADTITILSNQCLPGSSRLANGNLENLLDTPTGQINCGLPSSGRRPIGEPAPYIPLRENINFYTVTSSTAVNAAFLSSTVRSCGNDGAGRGCGANPATHSGAINNYIRMLEGWGQARYFNYSGSFVSLGPPLEHNTGYLGGTGLANGTGTNNYYNIPVRNFNFDNNFNNFNLLPPLSPRAIYLQQDVFRRNY
jgi:Tfp pilus assembly protein PilX